VWSEPRSALARACALLRETRDLLEGRVEEAAVPAWCASRGWAPFLLGLDDAALVRFESGGLAAGLCAAANAPPSLVAFADALDEATTLPSLVNANENAQGAQTRGATLRKVPQLDALLPALDGLARAATRIVDVGSGRGALSRLAARRFGCPVVGLERCVERVATASAMASRDRVQGVAFEPRDVFVDGLGLRDGDLALGLHACGELGDQLVSAAVRGGADVVLVACCPQKLRAAVREPLSRAAAGLALPRSALGLANLTAQAHGVEVPLEVTMRSREVRFALRRLLRERGVELRPGEEMQGVNRKRARSDLASLAGLVCAARGLSPPSPAELALRVGEAKVEHALVRRLSLPRSALGRLLEVCVALDRAVFLEENELSVVLATFVPRAVTPRNIALFASRHAERLPRLATEARP
jgi:SAM-dependent methyltransferase